MLFEGEPCTESVDFEFRSQVPKQKKKRGRDEIYQTQGSGSLLDADPREVKVRIIERLSYISECCSVNHDRQPQEHNPQMQSMLELVDTETLSAVEMNMLSRVTEKVVECLFQSEMGTDECLQVLNCVDGSRWCGSLLHYVIAANLPDATLNYLISKGADLELKAAELITPL